MVGRIQNIGGCYNNEELFRKDVAGEKGKSKLICIGKDTKDYEVTVGSTSLRKIGFAVGMVLTGFVPFLLLNFYKPFHDYFFGQRKIVQIKEDPLRLVPTTNDRIAALNTLSQDRRLLIERWQKSDAAQHYRPDLTYQEQEDYLVEQRQQILTKTATDLGRGDNATNLTRAVYLIDKGYIEGSSIRLFLKHVEIDTTNNRYTRPFYITLTEKGFSTLARFSPRGKEEFFETLTELMRAVYKVELIPTATVDKEIR